MTYVPSPLGREHSGRVQVGLATKPVTDLAWLRPSVARGVLDSSLAQRWQRRDAGTVASTLNPAADIADWAGTARDQCSALAADAPGLARRRFGLDDVVRHLRWTQVPA